MPGAATRPEGMGPSSESRTQAGPKACKYPLGQEGEQVAGAELSLRPPTTAPSCSKMTGWDDILRTLGGWGKSKRPLSESFHVCMSFRMVSKCLSVHLVFHSLGCMFVLPKQKQKTTPRSGLRLLPS